MDTGLSALAGWIMLLRDERYAKTPNSSHITPERIKYAS